MQRFNTVQKLIVAPALVIALAAGSAMARPRQHFGGADHHRAQVGQSEMSQNTAHQVADVSTTVTGETVSRIANRSSLEATQNVGNKAVDTSPKSLGSLNFGDDVYLDGEAHILSVGTGYASGLAQTNTRVGDTDGTIKQDAEQKIQDMPAIDYIDALAFYSGIVLQFKQWQDNPTKMPIGTQIGIKRAAVAAGISASQHD
ncbi:hypothetical protein D1823_14455 [Ruegeria sp. AD91A]|uniref:hypothetical protein n=1 Tax=Ruegeria sp. AD91A TaxID=2293862 RepID=UPI000E4CBD0A|nr:hypothetical protein [Ruegeria sp. AD91A]AXT27660.1 hypothetical protein D1823_14455 [Ruegeria sp. AD91A]